MRKKGISRSQLFLIELIIVVLFFSLAAAMVTMVFAKAHELSAGASALNGALSATQSTAELDRTKQLGEVKQGSETVYFDNNWKATIAENAEYRLNSTVNLETRPAGFMAIYRYTVGYASEDTKTTIYKLEMKKYYSGTPDNGSMEEVN